VFAAGVIVFVALVGAALSRVRAAYRSVKNAQEFSTLFVGQPPTVSAEALEFNVVAHLPWSAGLFRRLVLDGSPAGQLYGLCGLSLSDKHDFGVVKQRYADRREVVHQTVGCISVKASLGSVVYPEGETPFEDSCRLLELSFSDLLRATRGRLSPR
jgi:hypothetical protein